MILLLRVFLISLIVYLLLRSFLTYGTSDKTGEEKKGSAEDNKPKRKISKDVGEYIDFEEKGK